MVNVSLTVKEIVAIIESTSCDDLYNKLLKALEDAIVSVPPAECSIPPIDSFSRCATLILKSIPPDQFINAIRIIRNTAGTSLYEAKKFCDVVRGGSCGDYRYSGYEDGKPNSMEIADYHIGHRVATQLRDIGCDAHYL
jgi:ribosomal protein L7/L12